jgi:hypothetical protein
MIDVTTARKSVADYLGQVETEMNSQGPALPEFESSPEWRLVITNEQEYEFGWVFCFTTKGFVDTGDISFALAGNAPLIVDRGDGRLYVTGTAYPLEHYIDEYRNGVRHLAK